jgi:hypothetical protein
VTTSINAADAISSLVEGAGDRCTERAGDPDYHIKRRAHEILDL